MQIGFFREFGEGGKVCIEQQNSNNLRVSARDIEKVEWRPWLSPKCLASLGLYPGSTYLVMFL